MALSFFFSASRARTASSSGKHIYMRRGEREREWTKALYHFRQTYYSKMSTIINEKQTFTPSPSIPLIPTSTAVNTAHTATTTSEVGTLPPPTYAPPMTAEQREQQQHAESLAQPLPVTANPDKPLLPPQTQTQPQPQQNFTIHNPDPNTPHSHSYPIQTFNQNPNQVTIPITALTSVPGPVICHKCGVRGLTVVRAKSGGLTQ